VVLATLTSDSATGIGLTAGAIAVGGFIAHIQPALSNGDERRLREATVKGAIGGIWAAVVVIVLSVLRG
jgi:hypothetical protein